MEFSCGILAIYSKTKYPEHAARFLQFLTSERFNLLVARSGDSLPPVPRYMRSEEFLRPPDHPLEWQAGPAFADISEELGIALSQSPFVQLSVFVRTELQVQQSLLASRLTPEEAAKTLEERINREIELTISEDAKKRKLYEELLEVQKKIDARKAAKLPIPREWISNPFHLRYYETKGLLTEEDKL